jgi:hypothetical protein
MKLAIELFAILVALNVALALQAIYAAQQRELHELHKQGFGAGLHPHVETAASPTSSSPRSVWCGSRRQNSEVA